MDVALERLRTEAGRIAESGYRQSYWGMTRNAGGMCGEGNRTTPVEVWIQRTL